jgi:hypothetical protein
MNEEKILLFKEYFEYSNGRIFWKKSSGTRGVKGTEAGKLRKDGYYDVGLKGKYYLVHRIIFSLHHDILPEIVDHINRCVSDNRIENLRASDNCKNAWNSGINTNNTSGAKGIRKTKNYKYEARVAVNKITIQVGTFETLEEAKFALEKVRQKEHEDYACNG